MDESQNKNRLTLIDLGVLILYFTLLMGVGFYSMLKHNRSTVKGYFLANQKMTWIFIGASLFATNIGAEHFIGLASSGAAKGFGVGAFEIAAIGIIQLLGWVFLPVFLASGASTLPEYMNRRFGGQRIRTYIACLYLLLYISTKISVNIYASSLFINYLLSWNIYLSIIFVLVLTALCTICGGLATVMYTDTIQAIIMVIGGLCVMILSYNKIGSLSNFYNLYLNATPTVPNDNLWHNSTIAPTCDQPTIESFQMLKPISDPCMPWLGFFLGHTPNIIWYWCSDQMMVQRVLAARSISHARGGTLLAGYFKILPFFMIIIPGMISRALYPNIVACNQPSTCQAICNSKRSCTNIAYPTLIVHILPLGFKGMMVAVMLAALISGLTSIFNSASTIFTVDIYPNLCYLRRNQIKNQELMIVGRLFVVFMTLISLLWIPIVVEMQGSEIYVYMQQVIGFFAPPIACVYLLAILWTRINELGAFCGLMVGFIFGLLRMILQFSKQPPLCGEEDTRLWLIRRIHFMYYSAFVFWITFFICVIVSLCTKPPTKEQLFRTTYWTKNQKLVDELELTNHKPYCAGSISSVSKPIEFQDANLLSQACLENSNDGIEESTLMFYRQKLRLNLDANENCDRTDVSLVGTRQNLSESLLLKLSNDAQLQKPRRGYANLLKVCCSWFCGLNDDGTELQTATVDDSTEQHQLAFQTTRHSSMIKWLLNGNLIFLLLVQLTLFIVLSIPIKYTFLKS
ncbi:unnamed protein product [Rotaria socialis]